MRSEMNFKDQRLLEALDHLDPEFIDEALDVMRIPPANPSPERDRKTTFLSIKLVVALAASLLLISACIPVVSNIIRNYFTSPGGLGSSEVEETTNLPESDGVTSYEETTSPTPIDYSDVENLPELYRKVLKNEMKFHMMYYGEKKELTLSEAPLSYTSQTTSLYYTAVDMDGDGEIEVAVKNNHLNTDTIVLHIEGDRVYGFYFYMSELEEIQDDGNFIWSNYSDTMVTGFSRLTFPGGYEHKAVEICSKHAKTGETRYYVSGRSATREEYNAVYDTLSKTEIKWYPLDKYLPEATETEPDMTEPPVVPQYDGSLGLEYKVNEDGKSAALVGIGSCTDRDIVIATHYNGYPVTEIAHNVFYGNTSIKSIQIPDTVKNIGYGAFNSCGIETIHIPKSVTDIHAEAFGNMSNLRKISVAPDNPRYYVSGNCLIDRDTCRLIRGCADSVIPADGSVTIIGPNSFSSCTELREITLPFCLFSIEWAAFSHCSSLKSIKIPNGVEMIDNYAFSMCTSLAEVNIPDSVTFVGRGAFTSCPITSIRLGEELTSVEAETFMNCKNLVSVTLPRGIKSIDLRAFKNCTSLTSFTFEGSTAEWKAIEKDKTWKDYAFFKYVHCSDGDIKADIMTADVARVLAADYLGVIVGAKDPETGYKTVFWVKKEPTAASPRYVIAVSHEVSGDYYPIAHEVYVDIYSGECGEVVYDFGDISENMYDVITNKKTFTMNISGAELYLKDSYYPIIIDSIGYSGILKYAVIDMDGDGRNEVIISDSLSSLILHDNGTSIRGYYTEILALYASGTFSYGKYQLEDVVTYKGIAKASFTEDGMTVNYLCYTETDKNDNVKYFIGEREVSAQEYFEFVETYSSYPAEWRELDYYPINMMPPM